MTQDPMAHPQADDGRDEPPEETEPITVTVTYPQGSLSEKWKKVFYIDKATKLVMKIAKYELQDQEYQHDKTYEMSDYNQPIDEILHDADLALYHAKLKGRNRSFIYSDESFEEFYEFANKIREKSI